MRKINLSNFTLATSLTARDINARIVLNVIRTHQPLSRADVARQTGLQRSTVSLIADELIEEGWVVEGEYGRLPRGRRPIFLQLNSESVGIIGVNIERWTTRVSLGNLNGNIIDRRDFATEQDYSTMLGKIAQVITDLRIQNPNRDLAGVGVSLPGRIRNTMNKIVFVSGLDWREVDIASDLERRIELPVLVDNVANAVAISESYFGQENRGYDNLVAITISEVVSAGIVAQGNLVRGATGMAGEIGHVKVQALGNGCECGGLGCLESVAGNIAVVSKWNERRGVPPPEGDVTAAYHELLTSFRQGEEHAVAVMHEVAEAIGTGLATINSMLEPNLILIVGEITEVWDLLAPRIEKVMETHWNVPGAVRIAVGKKNVETRLCGAMSLLLHRFFAAPEVG